MSKVYHYTAWAYLPAIVAADALRVGNVGAPGELPLLWFSAHQQWEPTATKMWRSPSGKVRQMTFAEQAAQVGCIRFGMAADDVRLMGWKAACAYAKTPREQRRAMEQVGKKHGANPAHWFAVALDVPLSSLSLEVFLNDAWHPAIPGEMAEVWQDRMKEVQAGGG